MTESAKLSQETTQKLSAIHQSSQRFDGKPNVSEIIEHLATYYLIREGSLEELSDIQEEKEDIEARWQEWREDTKSGSPR